MTPSGLISGWHVWPGFVGGTGYHRIVSALRTLDPTRFRVREFPYDWRLSIRRTAKHLESFIGREVTRTRADGARPSDIVLVCHSMGGLVARYYLEVLGGRERVSKLITIGTPFAGSVKAVRVLAGDAARPLGGLNEMLTAAARSFPSVRQLLPSFPCVQTDSGLRKLESAVVPRLPGNLVSDAAALQAEVRAAVRSNGHAPYTTHVFGGRHQPTDASISIGSAGLGYHRIHGQRDYGGDGTVPRFSCVPPEWHDDSPASLFAARHSALQSCRPLLDQVLDKLCGVELGAFLAPALELTLDVPELVAPGQATIPVSVTAKEPDLLLRVALTARDGRETADWTGLRPDGAGNYHGKLASRPGAWRVTVETVAVTPPVRISEIVLVPG
jgi:pimeloyl-ACP methyl ester carboxylesterase